MKNLFSLFKNGADKRGRQLWFTNDFFKFLLGFSLLILASFGILAFFGSTSDSQSTVSDVPGCDTTDTDKTGTGSAPANC